MPSAQKPTRYGVGAGSSSTRSTPRTASTSNDIACSTSDVYATCTATFA